MTPWIVGQPRPAQGFRHRAGASCRRGIADGALLRQPGRKEYRAQRQQYGDNWTSIEHIQNSPEFARRQLGCPRRSLTRRSQLRPRKAIDLSTINVAQQKSAARLLLRNLLWEIGLGTVVILIVGLLGTTPPPMH